MNPEGDDHWHGGWLQGARVLASPHCDERPEGATVDLLVLHSISLPPGRYGGSDVEALFLGTLDSNAHPYYERLRGVRVSAHFYIRRDGSLLQFVDCDRRAWHAGASCYRGRSRCNDDSIGVELEGLEGDAFEAAQYSALAQLARAVAKRYPIDHIAGHEHIAPGRKGDPGAGFDWVQFQAQLRIPNLHFPSC